jgi:hydroxyethylthiazole kinase-like uncharacterized protein yjeF
MLASLAYPVERVRSAEQAFPQELADGTLMDRAAWAAANVAVHQLHRAGLAITGARVVILVGSGNNGGDALWAGARLRARGADVQAIAVSDQVHAEGAQALRRTGGRIHSWVNEQHRCSHLLQDAQLILDGLVGIGAVGPLRTDAAALVAAARSSHAQVLAIDIPSGIDADTGQVAGPVLPAQRTVTFGCVKPGLLLAPARDFVGALDVVDIGIGGALTEPACRWLSADDAQALTTALQPRSDDHKYRRGVVGVVAGSRRYPGAAQLTVGAALRSGVGMVRFLDRADGCAQSVVQTYPEVVIDGGDPVGMDRVHAWVCGPGLTEQDDAAVTAILQTPVPVLLDATALNLLAASTGLRRLVAARTAPTVLTPHTGEAQRLADALGVMLGGGALQDAQALADASSAVVLLKGPSSVVAGAGAPWVNRGDGPELSCAGSGDVFSGLAAGLLARTQSRCVEPTLDRESTAQVVALAAYLHGLAGASAKQRLQSPLGSVVATDLLTALA